MCATGQRLERHIALLRSNFALVGDSGEGEGEGEGEEVEEGEGEEGEGDGKLIKESDDTYSIWASGRVNCEGFLAQIKVYALLYASSVSCIVIVLHVLFFVPFSYIGVRIFSQCCSHLFGLRVTQ